MKKLKILLFVAIQIVAILFVFTQAITLNPMYVDGASFWCMYFTANFGVWALFRFGEIVAEEVPNGGKNFSIKAREAFPKWVKYVLIVPWGFLIFMMIFSSVFFHWKAYRDQLGEPRVVTFSSDMQMLDMDQIPIVDRALALKLADKKLGERPSLGSQVVLGNPTIQEVNGKLIWVVPLHHSGLFKWITNMSGTPGYITVSATDVNDVEYVDDYLIKYHPSGYLVHDVKRHMRLTGGLFTGISDYAFELDDNGVPHWIVTTYRNLRGFALPEATGAYVMNATTGSHTYYKLEDIPDWVDRVQPEDYILRQIGNQGEYVHGFLNFSDRDKYKASNGSAIIYNNGQCYLFTGLTSVGQDSSAIGFILVDMVTKEPILYQMNGATENAGQNSAQGKVQHLGYTASFPIILNIEGQPTFFMTLKDREGLIKQYAFVSIVNYSSVGVGETIPQALQDYYTVLGNDTSSSQFLQNQGQTDSSGMRSFAEGVVLRIASEYSESGTVYKMILDGQETIIYVAPASVSNQLALTLVGDEVELEFFETEQTVVNVLTFQNNSIGS